MGFKIRDKSLFWTRSGWKNNWQPKILNMPRPVSPTTTMYLLNRLDHHSFLRLVQSYRNYSRVCKQYLHGDKMAEQVMIMELRSIFKIPFTCETPVDQIKHGPERRMADQLDRDYQLLTHNYHPMQTYIYELRNKHFKYQTQQAQLVSKGQKTVQQVFGQQLRNMIDQEQSKLGPGQTLSLQKTTEIFQKLTRSVRAQLGQHKSARNQNGQFNDYLEKRRPFLNPDNERPAH